MCLTLNGTAISNDSYVLISDIGIDSTGLHCNTNRNDCCHASNHPNGVAQGHWFYPDGREVMSFVTENTVSPASGNFFFRNRSTGIVRLNRNGNPERDRGRFCCKIPDASGEPETVCVIIGKDVFLWYEN